MTMSMQATYNAINAATRHLADNPKLPIWSPPKNNVRASLVSANNIVSNFSPVIEQPSSQKTASPYKRFTHFFQCKKATPPHTPPAQKNTLNFYRTTVYFDTDAIRRSFPGETLQIKTSKNILTLYQIADSKEKYYWSKPEIADQKNEPVFVVRDMEETLRQLIDTQAEIERFKTDLGDNPIYHFELNLLIDHFTSFREKLELAIIAHIDKQRTLSTEKIKQICSNSELIAKRTEKLLKETNSLFSNKANNKSQKEALNNDIQNLRTDLEYAYDTVRESRTWYFSHELMEMNNALTVAKEARLRLYIPKIPRPTLKQSPDPTQSNC